MRILLVSDLHLGSRNAVDVLRRERALAVLTRALADIDRLVLLGDTIELRQGPAHEALEIARGPLEAIGEALPADAEVVLLPGNHDYALAAPWLEAMRGPLGLEQQVAPSRASPIARRVATWLGAKRTTVAYPGIWLRDGVYATHGHFQDVHSTIPTFERIGAGAMQRLSGGLPEGVLTPDDYERILAPLYAWMWAAAQRAPEERAAAGANRSAAAYRMLSGDGHRPMRARVLGAIFPLGIRGLNMMGVGPLDPDLSGDALRRGALNAMGEVLRRMGVEADDVIFGHTHRPGPLRGDDGAEWVTAEGTRLNNTGNWVYEDLFLGGADGESPYWPGGAVRVDGGGRPKHVRLLARTGAAALRPPDPA